MAGSARGPGNGPGAIPEPPPGPTQRAHHAQRPSAGSGAAASLSAGIDDALAASPSACQIGDYPLVTDWPDLPRDNVPSPAAVAAVVTPLVTSRSPGRGRESAASGSCTSSCA